MSAYTRWYRDGSVAVTKGSNTVVGTNTYWLTAGLNPGDIFKIDGVDYEIVSITDNTHLTIAGNYAGTTDNNASYAIVRNFTAQMSSKIAAATSELLGDFAKYIDNDMQSIHGKSAYQIACEKGYVGTESEWVQSLKAPDGKSAYEVACENGFEGTESEWLESLIGAGQWNVLDERTTPLTWNTAAIRNSIARGQNLGEFTAAHLAEIKAGTFRGMWLGDYFTVNSIKYVIAGFLYYGGSITLVRESKTMTYNTSENLYAPYCESDWYTNTRPALIEEIETAFGADNIPVFGIYGTASYGSDGKPDAWVLLKSKLHLPTYSMIMGEVWSPYHHFVTSGYRNTTLPYPFYYTQLPLFAHSFKPAGVQYVMSCVSDVDGKNSIIVMLDKNRSGWPYDKTGQSGKVWMAPVFHVGFNGNLGWSGW